MAKYYRATRVSHSGGRPLPRPTIDVFVCDDDRPPIPIPGDPFGPDARIESALIGVDQADISEAIAWLTKRGCSADEAVRIVDTAMRHVTAQSTGTGPTEFEAAMDMRMEAR